MARFSSKVGLCPSILFYLCVFQVAKANCSRGWQSWRDSCYMLLAEKLDWYEASRICGQQRGSLAVPNSFAENHFLHQIQRNECLISSCGMWIGCQYRGMGFTCLNKAPSFTYWVDHFRLSENGCVIMSLVNGGKWQTSTDCMEMKCVVCKMPRQNHVYSLTMASDGRVTPRCLRGHEIKNVTVKGVIKCGAACWAEPRCRSFNLWQGGPHKICQLNNATILESYEGDVFYDRECKYFEL